MREDVQFKTRDGTPLGGWLFKAPPAKTPGGLSACIVMSHGLTAQIDFGLAPVAEFLQAAGFTVLAFDHRGWGRSGGEPRMETNPLRQVQDTRDAITFAGTLAGVDARRIGLWGTSLSGGTALMLAAVDRRIKSVVAVCPFVSGSRVLARQLGDKGLAQLRETFAEARRTEMLGGGVQYRQLSALQETIDWFTSADREGQWQNRISVLSHDMLAEFEPGDYAARIAPTPLLMVVPEQDTRVPTDLQLETFDRAQEPKRLVLVEGGHYDPYEGQRMPMCEATRDWFLATLA